MASFGSRLRELAPHYVAMVALILMVVWTADAFFELSQVARFLLAALVVVIYPLVLRALGVAPDPWA